MIGERLSLGLWFCDSYEKNNIAVVYVQMIGECDRWSANEAG